MSSTFSRKITMSTFSGCFTGEGTPWKPTHRTQAHVQIENLAQRDVERTEATTDRGGQRAFDTDEVFAEFGDRVFGQPVARFVEGLFTGQHLEPLDRAARASWAAASRTCLAAGQMSTPVPSPSMNGMMGSLGTLSVPSAFWVIF